MPGPVSTWMGDRLWADKQSRYVTATEVDSAFYPPWDGKMSIQQIGFVQRSAATWRRYCIHCHDDSTINIVVVIITILK